MTSLSEQLSAVRQSQWEAQLDILRTLSNRALDSAEQLIALNMKTSRASVEQAAGTLKQMLEANNPRDLYVLSSGAQGQWQNVLAYSRELLGIATGARVLSWTTQPAPTRLLPAPSPRLLDLPSSVPQALEQVSIATASATSINGEIAAAAADNGAALAEATLQAGTDTLARASAQAVDTIEAAAPQPAPDAPVPEVTELEAETTSADSSETPQPDTVPAPADATAQAPQAESGTASVASAASEAVLEITVAPEAIVDAIVDQAIGDDAPPAKATPLVEALNEIAPEPVSARHPIASTVPLENDGAVEMPVIEPVDAAPPVPQATERRRAPRAPRKK